MITAIIKPKTNLLREIRPFEPNAEFKKDFHKSLRIVVIECEKTGIIYDGTGKFFLNFKLYLN